MVAQACPKANGEFLQHIAGGFYEQAFDRMSFERISDLFVS